MSQHHDPVHPEGPHLEADVIADLQVGALDASSAQHAQEHLDQCPQCQETAAALDDVATMLADLPPVTAPDDVVAGWLAALAAEPIPAPAAGGATVVPLGSAASKRSSFATRGLAIAASAAAVLLVAALAYPMLTGNGGGGGSTVAALDGGESNTAAPVVMPAATTSGIEYQPASLNTQVSSQLADDEARLMVSATPSPLVADTFSAEDAPTPTSSTMAPSNGVSGTSDPLRAPLVGNPSAELACISNVLVAGQAPILVDVAKFAGKAAVIVVVPTDSDPTKMDIWVLARHCTATTYQVLYWSRTDRP